MKKTSFVTFQDITIEEIKSLNLYESKCGEFNTKLGFSVCYTRVTGGIIRTVMTTETINQVFVPLPLNFFN